jgi:hypothetical protein
VIGALLTAFATRAKAIARERLKIRICRHLMFFFVFFCFCRRWWSFVTCLFQFSAAVGNAEVRYPLWCHACAIKSHQTMWDFPLRPHSLANGYAAIVIGALLTAFATGAWILVRERLTIRMCCHGLWLSVVVVVVACHVPLAVQCSGDNCAAACTSNQCGGGLPSVVLRLRQTIIVRFSFTIAHSYKWLCRHIDWRAADGVPRRASL